MYIYFNYADCKHPWMVSIDYKRVIIKAVTIYVIWTFKNWGNIQV